MHTRLTYWTGVWEPSREALSKQVAELRRTLDPSAPVVSVAGQATRVDLENRVVRLNNRHSWMCWLAASAIERRGDITHVVGALDSWLYLRALGRRPIVFTVAIPGRPLATEHYRHVAMFVAESETLVRQISAAGVSPERIRLVPPGIDLEAYGEAPLPGDRPLRLLFASTPAAANEIELRGLRLLIELARNRPDVEIVTLWRTWGEMEQSLHAIRTVSPPPNFIVQPGDVADMAGEYRRAHATVCAFAEGFGKSCPNFVAEGLATGRPALLTEGSGIADLVTSARAGVVVPRTVEGLVRGVDQLKAWLPTLAANARTLAEERLDVRASHAAYREIYDAVATRGRSTARSEYESDGARVARDGEDLGGARIASLPLHLEKPAKPARH